ncbi:zinc ribbon domain-containing protein [Acrocarpospora catenulata]|uniref:zinc ribbon domain-containing protein n=1 Tax=Acrocarpospora catenulata TaxID=2836182 RepID=UPI001BDA27D7|nr:zinc ribbon domain-containing protein [Acrocarpospora catenulata]
MPRLAVLAGLGALGMLGMPMHPHPSGSTDRVTPGAVRVESESHVSITLFDDRSKLQQVVREYDTDLAKGSGFTVTPDGVIVTATSVVQSDLDVRVYAANRVFAEYFKVKVPADFERHTLDDPDLNIRLQACYPPRTQNSTCNATVTTKVTVFPYLDPPLPQGLKAEVLTTGDSPAAPAVLKVDPGGKDNLPTVPLGTTLTATVESVDIMGLPQRPTPKAPPKLDTAHFDPPGSRSFKEAERAKVEKAAAADGIGAAIIDDGKSEVVALLAGGPGLPTTVTPVEDIRSAMVAAGVSPRRGPVDVVYENALASYHNKLYAAAVPVLQQVLTLRQDHAVALNYLKVARSKAGTAEDAATQKKSAPPAAKQSNGVSPWIWVAGGVVLAGAAVGIAVPILLKRRRAGNGTVGGEPPMENAALVTSWPAQTEMFPPGGMGVPGVPGGMGGIGVTSQPPVPHQPPPSDLSPPRGQAHVGQPIQVGQMGHPQVKFCTQCGMRLGHGHRFCGFCGHPTDAP